MKFFFSLVNNAHRGRLSKGSPAPLKNYRLAWSKDSLRVYIDSCFLLPKKRASCVCFRYRWYRSSTIFSGIRTKQTYYFKFKYFVLRHNDKVNKMHLIWFISSYKFVAWWRNINFILDWLYGIHIHRFPVPHKRQAYLTNRRPWRFGYIPFLEQKPYRTRFVSNNEKKVN